MTVDTSIEDGATHDPASVSVSANGRYLAFESYAQLVPADTNRRRDIYVLDRTTGKVTLETVLADGRAAEADTGHPGLSADGELLVYQTNLPSSSDSPASHVVLRHRTEGRATVITAQAGAASPRLWSHSPVVSGNGRIVIFVSSANLIAAATTNGHRQELYAYDVVTGLIRHVASHPSTGSSVAPAVADGANGWIEPSVGPALDARGEVIAFSSRHPIDGNDVRNDFDVFVRVNGQSALMPLPTGTPTPGVRHRYLDDIAAAKIR